MCCINVAAADDFFALCFEFIHLVEKAIVESQFELNEVISSSSVGEVDVIENEIAEISLDHTAFMVEFLYTESEFNALWFDL